MSLLLIILLETTGVQHSVHTAQQTVFVVHVLHSSSGPTTKLRHCHTVCNALWHYRTPGYLVLDLINLFIRNEQF